MNLVFGLITPTVAGVLLIIALIIFGPGKLPQIGKALGGGIKEFRAAASEAEKEESGARNEAS
jgi:sec-independent protein translocase protein TatA